MRSLVFVLGVFVTVTVTAACGGEVDPDTSGQTKQNAVAGDADKRADETAGSSSATSDSANTGNGNAGGTGEPTSCFKDFGPDAPGECTVGDVRACDESTNTSPNGFCQEKCINVDGKATWGLRTTNLYCPFNDTSYHLDGPNCTCNTPLVLSFDDAPVVFTSTAGGAFDLSRDGMCHSFDWPSAHTPWLALDRDGNGSIDGGNELFGSATPLVGGGFAENGFQALRELDANHDGVFDARDPAFAQVVVWTDRNGDRRSTANELVTLSDTGVTAIDLHDQRQTRCDTRGNCEGERSGFTFVDGTTGRSKRGVVIDVYLKQR